MNNFKVDFIGIGAQRAASSWIYKCLSEHPQLCGSQPKETFYFAKNYNRGLAWYEDRFKHCASEKIKGEYSVLYLSDLEAPVRIKKHNPNVKLIACLRNPIERAWSHYHFKLSNREPIASFKDGLERYPEIRERGFYHEYLSNYLKYFSREQVLILVYEDIAGDPAKFIRNIYEFLDVDINFIPAGVKARINTREARASNLNKKIIRLKRVNKG